MGGGRTFGGDDDCASLQAFAAVKSNFIFVQRFDFGVEAQTVCRKLRRELCRDRSHTARGNGGVAFGQHFENKFKHAAGGFQFAVEQDAADERTKEAMDHFLRKTFGKQIVLGGVVCASKELIDGGAPEAGAQTGDAEFVAEGAKVGTQRDPPHSRHAPGIDELVHAAGEPGKCAGRESS